MHLCMYVYMRILGGGVMISYLGHCVIESIENILFFCLFL